MRNLLLLVIAIILFIVIGSLGFVYSIIVKILRTSSVYFWQIALAIDELGNTVCQDLFNDTMRAKGGHRFGNSNETVSHVLGKLKAEGKLLPLGKFLAWILNKIDKYHVEKAAENPQ
jgi:hypothetical protein